MYLGKNVANPHFLPQWGGAAGRAGHQDLYEIPDL